MTRERVTCPALLTPAFRLDAAAPRRFHPVGGAASAFPRTRPLSGR